jgi:phospholipase/lecithinase/hemolysin
MLRTIRAFASTALALCIAMSAAPALAGSAHGRIIAFGDSLSDPGNYFAAFGTVSVAPYAPVPDSPYAIGKRHFSNGATWIEQVAEGLDRSADAGPALRSPGRSSNYAVGRARARANAPSFPDYDLTTQVNLFLRDVHGAAPSDALYVIWIGSNDLNDALHALSQDPTGGTSFGIIQSAVVALGDNAQALWASGARHFLIVTIPDLALTPAVQAGGPAASYYATMLTGGFDGGLQDLVGALSGLPGSTFDVLDANGPLQAFVANPAAFGLSDVTAPCLSFGTIVHPVCAHPDSYLFWDAIHPTTAGHRLIAAAALPSIKAIYRRLHWSRP